MKVVDRTKAVTQHFLETKNFRNKKEEKTTTAQT